MATALVGFVGARLAITNWVRPNLASAVHTAVALDRGGNLGFTATPSGSVTFVATNPSIANAWTISSAIVDTAGRTQSAQALHNFIIRYCPTIGAPPGFGGGGGGRHVTRGQPPAFNACVAQLSTKFHLAVSYQPASHFWTIQWLEFGVYVVLSLILAAACLQLVRRRLR